MADPQGTSGFVMPDFGAPDEPVVKKPKEPEVSDRRKAVAALIRGGSGLAASLPSTEPGFGTLLGMLIGGGGEAGAEAVEGSLHADASSAKRIATEAGLSALPMGAYTTEGKIVKSALKSGAVSAAGEAMREKSKDQDLNPRSIATAGAIGGVTGGVFGRFLPGKAAPAAPKTLADAVATHGKTDLNAFRAAATEVMKREKWGLDDVVKHADDLAAQGQPDLADHLRQAAVQPNMWSGKHLEDELERWKGLGTFDSQDAQAIRRSAAEAKTGTRKVYTDFDKIEKAGAVKAGKNKTNETANTALDDALAAGGKKRRTITLNAKGVDPDTGQTITVKESVRVPKKKKGLQIAGEEPEIAPEGGAPVEPEAATPAGPTPEQKAIIDSWLKVGIKHDRAEELAAQGIAPRPETVAKAETKASSVVPVEPTPPTSTLDTSDKGLKQLANGLRVIGEEGLASRVEERLSTNHPPVAETPAIIPPTPTPKVEPPVVEQPPVTSPKVEPPAVVAPPEVPEAKLSKGQPKIDNVLDATDRAQVVSGILKDSYPEALSQHLEPLSNQYHQLTDQILALGKPVAGSAEAAQLVELKQMKGTIGMKMKVLTQEAEQSGLIPKGTGAQVSAKIADALEEANASKFASRIPLKGTLAPEPPSSTPIIAAEPPIEGPVPPIAEAGVDPKAAKVTADKLGAWEAEHAPNPKEEPPVEGVNDAPPPSEDGGTVVGMGLGGAQGLIGKHPQFALRAGLAGAGALVGGLTDPLNDPLMSAALGAGVGLTAPDILGALVKNGVNPKQVPGLDRALQNPQEQETIGKSVAAFIPQFQRFNYLMSASGLPANAFAGPYGSLFFGALAKGLGGDARGWAALKLASPANWGKEWWAAKEAALDLIKNAETNSNLVRSEMQGSTGLERFPQPVQNVFRIPAEAMAAGDLASRKILMAAGFTEEEAREMTLTAEPRLNWTKSLLNMARGSNSKFMQTLFPFVRTPLNMVEQAATRTPFVGFAVQKAREANGAIPQSTQEQVAQQALGALTMVGGYIVGTVGNPEDDPQSVNVMRKFVTNGAGPNAVLAGIGYALAQSSKRSQPSVTTAASEIANAIPLPTTQPIADAGRFLGKLTSGTPIGIGDLPRGLVPAPFREQEPWGLKPKPLPKVTTPRGRPYGSSNFNMPEF